MKRYQASEILLSENKELPKAGPPAVTISELTYVNSKKIYRYRLCAGPSRYFMLHLKCYRNEIFIFHFFTKSVSPRFTDHFELLHTEFCRRERI